MLFEFMKGGTTDNNERVIILRDIETKRIFIVSPKRFERYINRQWISDMKGVLLT